MAAAPLLLSAARCSPFSRSEGSDRLQHALSSLQLPVGLRADRLSESKGHHLHCSRRRPVRRQQRNVQAFQQQEATADVPTPEAAVPGVSAASQPGRAADVQTVPQMWAELAAKHGDCIAVHDPHQQPETKLTYRELYEQMQAFTAGLRSLGLQQEDRVSLFSENSSRWLTADQGIMFNGAADAVRGSTTPVQEQAYILRHSRSCGMIIQDSKALEQLLPHIGNASSNASSNGSSGNGNGSGNGHAPASSDLRFVVVLWGNVSDACRAALNCPVLAFDEVLATGRQSGCVADFPDLALPPASLATLVYTSGTTGSPKGVMLTHANLYYQVANFGYYIKPKPGDSTLSLLPPWHIYERATGYYIFSCGCKQVYSTIKKFREDLTAYPPTFFICVPLVLDTLHTRVMMTIKKGSAVKRSLAAFFLAVSGAYVRARRVAQGVALQYALRPRPALAWIWASVVATLLAPLHKLAGVLVYAKVRAALGVRQAIISGGGSLAPHLDLFYESIDLSVLNGWGLSETSPVLACRKNVDGENVRGTVGQVIPGTQLRAVDPETGAAVPDGQQGLLLAKGPGVMAGYFDDPASTAKAFAAGDGWFDTGDLGWRCPEGVRGSAMGGNFVLSGRSKDTIVLASGENIEPQPIEDALCVSGYIKFATVLGQDAKHLGALIVPDTDALAEAAQEQGKEQLSREEVHTLVRQEVTKATADRTSREHIRFFSILDEPYSPDNGTLTRTMKPRRAAIIAHYASEVEALCSQLSARRV